jgi:hypothetical protein
MERTAALHAPEAYQSRQSTSKSPEGTGNLVVHKWYNLKTIYNRCQVAQYYNFIHDTNGREEGLFPPAIFASLWCLVLALVLAPAVPFVGQWRNLVVVQMHLGRLPGCEQGCEVLGL